MNIIHKTADIVDIILDKQVIRSNVIYRPLTYLIKQTVEEGMLLYNVLTKCMVLLDNDEASHYEDIEYLKQEWFFVPEDNDDRKMCTQLRNVGNIIRNTKKNINEYTILTTTDCNARCFYCYEQGTVKISMSLDTARKVVEFIVNHSNGKNINIDWFGGEPLFNIGVIDFISEELKRINVDFTSSMISNGYLFDESVILRAKKVWNLKRVQITLDGTETVYNRSKRFIYKNVSGFTKVIENIEKVSNNGIFVYIRLNIDKYNINNIFELLNFLFEKFEGNSFIKIYTAKLYGTTDKGAVKRTDEERVKIYEDAYALEKLIRNAGFSIYNSNIPKAITFNSCMADNASSIMITPSGKLGRCEHYTDKGYCGDLDKGITNMNIYDGYEKQVLEQSKCLMCPYYPDCIRLVVCSSEKKCDDVLQKYCINKAKRQMQNTYNLYLKKQQINEDENDEIEIQC